MKIRLCINITRSSIPMIFLGIISLNSLSFSQSKHHNMSDSTLKHRQHMIHSNSTMVMPFNMSMTTHYFIKEENGGTLSIQVKDEKETSQIDSIRSHLMKEQKLFSTGDFRDPKTLHGMSMPGLKVLSESAGKFDVNYNEIPKGANLIFRSKDSTVINAIHKWFDAQLKDHGSDAKNSLN